jgi:hypothetical protein
LPLWFFRAGNVLNGKGLRGQKSGEPSSRYLTFFAESYNPDLNMMEIKPALPAFVIGILALILAACPSESDAAITKAEYTSENRFTVSYTGNSKYSVSFTAEGKDERYTVRSSSSFTLLGTKAVCKIDGRFISGDHITVTSYELLGSAEFDVPDYKD